MVWHPEELDADLPLGWRPRIASQARLPREARARPLRARKDHVCIGGRSGSGWRQAHLDVLLAHELHTGTPVRSPAPIAPEQRCGTHSERMQQHTHLARLRGSTPIPLTLLTQRTRTAVANAGRIHHAQAAISLSPPLLRVK